MTEFEPSVERVPDAEIVKTRSSAILRVFGSLIGLSLLTAAIVLGTALWGYSAYTANGPLPADKVVQIADNLPRDQLTKVLLDQGVITEPRIFYLAMSYANRNGNILKPGEYEFKAGSSMADIISMLRQGRVLTYKLTIPEGWTSQMALNRIMENEILSGDVPGLPPEGSLMADTFVFQRGMAREQLVKDMQSAQIKLVDALWSSKPADSPIKTKEELITLASIVEKETGKADERPQVAAVFLNRLKKGMRLQSDPTIIYGIVGSKGKLDRPLRRSDIEETTLYNTYRISGLPPGPIASPGRAAMEAVLNPAKVEYLYFVADGTGGHAFATTLEEHNDNVKRWRQIENGETSETPNPPAEVDPAAAAPTAPAATPDVTTTPSPAEPVAPVIKTPEVKKPEIKNTSTGLENLQLENDGSSTPKKAEPIPEKAVKPIVQKPAAKKPTAAVKPLAVKPAAKKITTNAVAAPASEKKPKVKSPTAEELAAAKKKTPTQTPVKVTAKPLIKKLKKPEPPKTN